MEVVSTTPQAAGRSIRTACASLEIRRPDGCSVPGGASMVRQDQEKAGDAWRGGTIAAAAPGRPIGQAFTARR